MDYLFSLDTLEWNFEQTILHKIAVLLGMSWELEEPFGESDWNTLGRALPPLPPLKKKTKN
jgi:hypothetical protein